MFQQSTSKRHTLWLIPPTKCGTYTEPSTRIAPPKKSASRCVSAKPSPSESEGTAPIRVGLIKWLTCERPCKQRQRQQPQPQPQPQPQQQQQQQQQQQPPQWQRKRQRQRQRQQQGLVLNLKSRKGLIDRAISENLEVGWWLWVTFQVLRTGQRCHWIPGPIKGEHHLSWIYAAANNQLTSRVTTPETKSLDHWISLNIIEYHWISLNLIESHWISLNNHWTILMF